MQGANLERELKVRVMDRAEVILDIFSTRARSHEAKLQVELAQLEYLLPRLTRMWTHLSRIRGGIGLRGPGETQLETDRRIIRKRIQALKAKLQGRRAAPREHAGRARPDAERGARRLHQRGQVQHPARALRAARDRRRGPALRHARHPDPRGGAGRGAARAGHRHGRLHPQAAPPSGRQLPRHARGGPRGRPAAARRRRQPSTTGKGRCTWSSGCWPSSTWPTGRSSRCSTRSTRVPDPAGFAARVRELYPGAVTTTTMRTDGLAPLKPLLRDLERAGRPTVRVRLPVTDGARLAALVSRWRGPLTRGPGESARPARSARFVAGGAVAGGEVDIEVTGDERAGAEVQAGRGSAGRLSDRWRMK